MAYGLDKKSDKEIFVLIFDFGGGTFDVSLLSIYNGSFEVRATNGDTHLGGEDFTNKLLSHCVSEIAKKTGIDISDNPRALTKLRTQCESAKIMLSDANKVNVDCYGIADGCDINIEISRARFDNLCAEVFQKCMVPIDRVLEDSKISKDKIQEIVLVGGSSRIPKVQQMLSDYFDGKSLNKTINPDEAVAYGAAIQAAVFSGQ